jgi:two-component system, LytTR family, response regulator
MIKVIIIEDEPKNIRILKDQLVKNCPQLTLIGEAENIEAAEILINQVKPNLVFLDIEMPYGNAFDLLDKLDAIDFEVVFITAFSEYALKAFKYSAIDYLLKPVDIDDLIKAVDKAIVRIGDKNSDKRIRILLENINNSKQQLQKIAVPTIEGMEFIYVDSIIRCEAQGSYTIIHTLNKQSIKASKNIKEYEDMLPAQTFCRIHNSHLINLNKINKYHKGRGGYVVMEDETAIYVASRRKDEFLSNFSK